MFTNGNVQAMLLKCKIIAWHAGEKDFHHSDFKHVPSAGPMLFFGFYQLYYK